MGETLERVTDATLGAGQGEEFQRRWDIALDRLRPAFGGRHGPIVDGRERGREAEREALEDRRPVDRRGPLGHFPVGTAEDVDPAVRAARRGFAAGSARHSSERAGLRRRAAELIEQRGCAGLFSCEQEEIDAFLERVEAGVVYVRPRAGATTGAGPGGPPFGGWKGAGSSGKSSGGRPYVQQFPRKQSGTLVR